MNNRVALIPILATLFAGPAAGQTAGHFYDVDKEVKLEGVVRQISFESRYKGTAPFLVLGVEESGSAKRYSVEVSPSWFFGNDIHGGEKVKIIGSLAEVLEGVPTIIAREIQLRGETIKLRDKRGFPNWQGGPQRKRSIRRFGSS
ncbi:MAG: hypothetical protein A2Y70_00470 [Candidatus Aminicenantes bacterium RBG_13_64_14]|nr:MAG: hypothetical protein A2Y70_00470 [Candidatus Aminicenantes bacterium RBG_13_64_14]